MCWKSKEFTDIYSSKLLFVLVGWFCIHPGWVQIWSSCLTLPLTEITVHSLHLAMEDYFLFFFLVFCFALFFVVCICMCVTGSHYLLSYLFQSSRPLLSSEQLWLFIRDPPRSVDCWHSHIGGDGEGHETLPWGSCHSLCTFWPIVGNSNPIVCVETTDN